jgi:hypothetical protein
MMETPPLPDEMSDPSPPPATLAERLRASARRLPVITAAAVILVVGGLSLLVWSLSGGASRPLFPNLPTFTPLAATVEFEAQEIGFTELNADPAAFQNQRLQVSGVYTPVEAPECLDYNGPIIRWSLVAEELQLNAIGFEDILRLVPEDTEMTVTGIWRAYRGPVGCGKEPEDGTVWYLEVERIVEPNPLFGATAPMLTVVPGTPAGTLAPEEAATLATPTPEVTVEMTTEITTTTTLPGIVSPTVTPTLPTTPLVTPLGTPGATQTLSPTADGTAALSPTPGPSPTPTATGGASGTTTPGLPTTTPSGTGYPSQGTPTATTTGGYP